MHLVTPPLSGERFQVIYRMNGSYDEAMAKAQDACIEQTVEFPADLLPAGDIPNHIIGRIEAVNKSFNDFNDITISYPVEDAGGDLVQLLNVIFGNTSIKPGIRVEKLILPTAILNKFQGPRFGRNGLRNLLKAPARPMLCSAIKPMGLTSEQFADQAFQFASGGIDIIKDDHGLADQPFAPFRERVARCAEAVQDANAKSGSHSIYMPSLGARADQIIEKAYYAKSVGAGGFLVPPGLVGFDIMRVLADDDSLALPIMMHPSMIGSFVTCPTTGFSHYTLFGQLTRLAGADATIYPNWGGRFAFSREECISIAAGSQEDLGHIKPIFPTPGGGMTIDRIPEMLDVYGKDLFFLMGGGLHRIKPTLVESSAYFRNLVENM
ncbi:MAG: ribulose 1,5-bisphosphate carboxylase large subunit [Chloroflexi bacterium HGW-Chloroflexi-5]|nr:MAG: ribulose 1,5-bisphosphate carboxylase large subunit [Chloroflexi bacterium HGW-Chloroflexi-5]